MMTTAMAGITTAIMAAITTTIGAGMIAMTAAMGVATTVIGMMIDRVLRARSAEQSRRHEEMDAMMAIQ